jgi:hypothetical protein
MKNRTVKILEFYFCWAIPIELISETIGDRRNPLTFSTINSKCKNTNVPIAYIIVQHVGLNVVYNSSSVSFLQEVQNTIYFLQTQD